MLSRGFKIVQSKRFEIYIEDVTPIYGINDYYKIFETESQSRSLGKHIMSYKF